MRWSVIAFACAALPVARPASAVIKVWVGTNGNWTSSTPWSPAGRPDHGDDVFLASGDAVNRTVTFNDTSSILRIYRSVRVDSTGSGLMTLQQQDPNTTLNADFLYVGNAARGTYDVFGGGGFFGATEVHAQGVLSFRSGTVFRTDTLLQTGGTVDAIGSFTVTGSYTFNGGAASGHVTAGTFVSNGGAYGGGVTALNRLVLGGNGNGTFASLTNHGPLTLPAGRTLALASSFGQTGETFMQLGDVSVGTFSSVNDGGTWLHARGAHVTRSLNIAAGGAATYVIGPGAQLTTDGLNIATGGDGSFTQTGGVVSITGNLSHSVTVVEPGRMSWNMSGGTFTHGGNFNVGLKDATSGTFIQSGGFARVRFLNVNVDATTSASVNLSGGTFIVDANSVSHGTLNVIGGVASFIEHLDGAGDVSVTGAGTLNVRRLRQHSLSVGGDGYANLNPPSFLPNITPLTHRVRELTFERQGAAVRGRVDLGGSRLVIDYGIASPAAQVREALVSGYAGGAWTGTGLMSSAASADGSARFALGHAEASDVLGAGGGVWNGLAVDGTALLIRMTRYGDANLDGLVNLADFNRLAASFGGTNKGWSQGDFNYDGVVNLQDFNRLASHFGLTAAGPDVAPDDWSALAAAVPEPISAFAFAGVAASAAMSRRARRRVK